jgi:diguanylate cyclase (GGDEF)-like protein/PAS domain S-box-containing protein
VPAALASDYRAVVPAHLPRSLPAALLGALGAYTLVSLLAGTAAATLVPAIAVTALVARAARHPHAQHRGFWWPMAVATALFTLADIASFVYPHAAGHDLESAAIDAFYLLGDVSLFTALAVLVATQPGLRNVRSAIDGAVLATALGTIGFAAVIDPLPVSHGADTLAAVMAIASVVGMVAGLLTLAAAGAHPWMRLIGLAVTCGAGADVIHAAAPTHMPASLDSLTDVIYLLQYAVLGLAAVAATRASHRDRPAVRDSGLPLLFGGFFLLLVFSVIHGVNAGALKAVMTTATVATLLRLWLTVRENRRMADRLGIALREQERISATDPLTGLHNRRFLEDVVRLDARGEEARAALLVIDLDHFKAVNDAHGHPTGDAVLRETAARLQAQAGPDHGLARYGGEEFVVLLPGAGAREAGETAERMRRAISATEFSTEAGATVRVTVSIGGACIPEHAGTDAELMRAADRAVYTAKHLGRNQVRIGPLAADEAGAGSGPRVLEGLADELDTRTGSLGHSVAVARWAAAVATELGLARVVQRRCELAGRLHDIGLVTVPDRLLRAGRTPSPAELAILRNHPSEGARVVAGEPELADLAPIIAGHHERLDGRGFPAGLEAADLSIETRILAVCEAWSRLHSGGEGTPAIGGGPARVALRDGAGTAWDPDVVRAFLTLEAQGEIGALAERRAPHRAAAAAAGPDAIATAAQPAGRDPSAPAPDPQRRRHSRRPAVLLASVLLVLAAWAGTSGTLYLRARANDARALTLANADAELHTLQTVRWRALLGLIAPPAAARTGDRHWRALVRAVGEAGEPELHTYVQALDAPLRAAAERLVRDPETSRRSAAGDRVSGLLARLHQRLEAEVERTRRTVARQERQALTLIGVGGAVALLLVALLLRAYWRTSRAALVLLTRAAASEAERRALADSARRFGALVQHATDAVVVIDGAGTVTFATDAVQRLLGRTPAELADREFAELVTPAQRGRLAGLLADVAGEPGALGAELDLRHRDGHPVHTDMRAADRREDPDVGGIVLTLRDVSERRSMQRQLEMAAVRDPRTGMANRLRFEQWVDAALRDAELTGRPGDVPAVAALLLDLNDFQTINDSLGHVAGDRCVAACGERLRAAVGDRGQLARVGGDEFALLLQSVGEPETAERYARMLLDALREPLRLDGADVPLTASVGVAIAAPGGDAQDLLRSAHTALHAAKRRGAGHVEVFTPAMHQQAVRRLELRSALAGAVERDELTLAYQPIVDLESGETAGVEALLRWEHDGQSVSPAQFIPVAEASGLIVPLGARVLERACREVAGRRRSDGEQLTVAVNVSAVQLRTPDFVTTVAEALDRSGLPAGALTLELTESAMVQDVVGVRAALEAARALGVRVAVDDFGTGWSSLATLASLPVDILKLDRSFVAAMDASPTHAALVDGVISMSARLGLPTVVEGVETAEQLERLRGFGARFAQGFHLGRPGPLAAAARPGVARS